jgi:hypothetical protein
MITVENTPHRIFLSDDTLTCYKCNLTGHTSKQCKNPTPDTPNTKSYQSSDSNNSINNTNISDENPVYNEPPINIPTENNTDISNALTPFTSPIADVPITSTPTQEDKTLIPSTDTNKRPALSSTSSSLDTNSPPPKSYSQNTTSNSTTHSTSNPNKIIHPLTKKVKRSNSIDQIILKLDEIFEPIKTSIEVISNKKINYEQFKYIIENTLSISNPAPVLEQFNITCLEMIEIIDTVRPKMNSLSIKNRLTRLCNTLLDKALSTDPNNPQ